MNVAQLREAFEGLVEDSVDTGLLLLWLNEAQEDIATQYGPVAKLEMPGAKACTAYKLPPDALQVQAVKDTQGDRYISFSTNEQGEISFADGGSFTVYYHRMPNPLEVGDDEAEPDLHPLLHTPLYIYAASMYYDKVSGADVDDSAMASKFLSKYERMVVRRVRTLKRRRQQMQDFVVGD